MNDVPRTVQDKLLAATGAMTIAVREGRMRRLVAMAEMPPDVSRHIDMSDIGMVNSIMDAVDTLLSGSGPLHSCARHARRVTERSSNSSSLKRRSAMR